MNCIEMDTKMESQELNIESLKLVLDLQNQLNREVTEKIQMLVDAIKQIHDRLDLMQNRLCGCHCHSHGNVKFWNYVGQYPILCCQCEVKDA